MKKYGFGKIVYMDNNNNVICKKTKNHNTNYVSVGIRILKKQHDIDLSHL